MEMDDATRELFRESSWRIWSAYCRLHPLMLDAIKRDHLASVQYLLEMGYSDARFVIEKAFTAEEDEMVVAYVHGRQDIGRQLHKRGFALDVAAEWHDNPAEFDQWLGPLPDGFSVGCVSYQHLNHVDPDLHRWHHGTAHVIVSWPPRRSVPLQITLASEFQQNCVEEYIAAIGQARRVEARHWLKKNLGFWRAWVRARTILLYWQECTQRRVAAPGGKGRQEDLEAFVSEFQSAI